MNEINYVCSFRVAAIERVNMSIVKLRSHLLDAVAS